jgi:hypothetical protein
VYICTNLGGTTEIILRPIVIGRRFFLFLLNAQLEETIINLGGINNVK